MYERRAGYPSAAAPRCLVGSGDLNIDSWLDGDRSDLAEDLSWSVEVDETLVDAHLEAIPGLGSLSAWGLAGGDAEHLGRHADWALDNKVLVLGSVDELSADLLKRLNVLGGQGQTDAVLRIVGNSLLILESDSHG